MTRLVCLLIKEARGKLPSKVCSALPAKKVSFEVISVNFFTASVHYTLCYLRDVINYACHMFDLLKQAVKEHV